MIVDVITFNGEYDLFEIRYNILKDYVDEFIIVEFDKTFSGNEKPFYGKELDKRFDSWQEKITYNYLTEKTYGKYRELAEKSPNTIGAKHWKREFMMKESIKDCLTHLKDDDIVFIGDVDEIVEPLFYVSPSDKLTKYRLRVYTYYLNNRSNEPFWGTISARYEDIKNECLNHLRNNHERKNTIDECGWHFTSMAAGLRQKLIDSYTEESYNTKWVQDNLEKNIAENKDFLGRSFTYRRDESEWPKYLKDNREKYKHLLLPESVL